MSESTRVEGREKEMHLLGEPLWVVEPEGRRRVLVILGKVWDPLCARIDIPAERVSVDILRVHVCESVSRRE